MVNNTRFAEIIDRTAAIAATVPGVRAVFGVGTGLVADPLRPGGTIRPALPTTAEPYAHVSSPWLGGSGDLDMDALLGMTPTVVTVPMRLYLDRTDVAVVAGRAADFPALYIAAFADSLTLGGVAQRWSRLSWQFGGDEEGTWIDWTLVVNERLALETRA